MPTGTYGPSGSSEPVGNRGSATALGAISFAAGGAKAGAKKGGIAGSLAGPIGTGVGIVGGAIVGGVIGYTAYTVGR